jgi:eukaryotic-like serine/threonine-protein kinase
MSAGAADAEVRIIGKYRLYGRIGAGGMGSVHLARFFAPGGFRRIVAVKRLHPQFAEDAAFVAAFLDEARLASRISHPNVVAPLDVIAEDGEVSLVFEHVLGVSLSTLVRRAKEQDEAIPIRITTSLMVNVLHGLQAAHEATGDDGEALGLVHRDVSPQNVLVGRDGSARLLDFGIAKATGRSQTTDEGVVKGKRGYMAPEHLVNATSQSSDIYSAAVMLWEIVAERRLFPDDSSIANRLAGDLAPLPSTFAKKTASEDEAKTLAALDAITLRGLAHDVAARFASAREMAIALEAVGTASSREVGEWVERVAHEELGERKRLVELAEASGSILPIPFPSTTSSRLAASPSVSESVSGLANVDVVMTPMPRPQWRRRMIVMVALVMLVVISGIAVAMFRHHDDKVIAASSSPDTAATSAIASDAPSSSAPAPVNQAGSAIAAVDSTNAPSLASASAKSHSGAAHPPKKRGGPPCKPYVIDKDGRTQFNEACLR